MSKHKVSAKGGQSMSSHGSGKMPMPMHRDMPKGMPMKEMKKNIHGKKMM